jgi:hypothetical protein
MAAHVRPAFDAGSALICDPGALQAGARLTTLVGAPADLVIFRGSDASAQAWPADVSGRVVLRAGRVVAGGLTGGFAS